MKERPNNGAVLSLSQAAAVASSSSPISALGRTLNTIERKHLTHFDALKASDEEDEGDAAAAAGNGGSLQHEQSRRQQRVLLPQPQALGDPNWSKLSPGLAAQYDGWTGDSDDLNRQHRRIDHKHRKRRGRRHLNMRPTFVYTWLKNGQPLDVNGGGADTYELAKNGTLKIAYSGQAAGVYQCIINGTRWNFGAIMSRASHVTVTGEMS